MNIETKLYKKRENYPNLHKVHTTLIFKIDKMIKILDQCDNFVKMLTVYRKRHSSRNFSSIIHLK